MNRLLLLFPLAAAWVLACPGCGPERVWQSPPSGGGTSAPRPAAEEPKTITQAPRPPADAIDIQPRVRVIFDFERAAHAAWWRPVRISKNPFQAWKKQFASKGNGSMAVDLDAGTAYPGVRLVARSNQPFDWSWADLLRLEVFNTCDSPVTLHMIVDSAPGAGGSGRISREFRLRPGMNHLRLPLRPPDKPPAFDLSHIAEVVIFGDNPRTTLRLYIDEFRLEATPEVRIPVPNARLFDFGPPGSLLMLGFQAVAPDATLDRGDAGFTVPPAAAAQAPYRIDSIADDYIHSGRGRAEFAVRLPNGRYAVAVFVRSFDDLDLPTRDWSITANGKLKKRFTASAANFYSTDGYYRGYDVDYRPDTDVWEAFARRHVPLYRFEADVTDGLLRIGFQSCALYGLMLWPADQAEWGERLIAQVQRMRRGEFHTFNYWHRPGSPAPTPAPTLAPVSYLEDIAPHFTPPAATSRRCTISAAPGEWEPAAFVFRSPIPYEAIQVRVTDFTGDAGTIPASSARIYLAKLYPNGRRGVYELLPTMLEPAGGQTLQADLTRLILVDVRVPDDAAPGTYHGLISLEAQGRAPLAAEVVINVRSFRLAHPPARFAMFYGSPARFLGHYTRFYHGHDRLEQAIAAEMQNMRDYGFNTLSIDFPRVESLAGDRAKLDFSNTARLARIAKRYGLARRHPALMSMTTTLYRLTENLGLEEFSPRYNAVLTDTVRQALAWANEHQLPVLLYIIDEPREKELAWWNRNFADTLRYVRLVNSVPGARSFVTLTADRNYGVDYTPLAQELDVVATHGFKSCRRLLGNAKELCIYNTGRKRLTTGFYTWKTGAAGRREWGYHWLNLPWNPLDDGNAAIVYPSPAGLLPTIDETRIREGIDDYRYIFTLQQKMQQAAAGGRDVSSAAALLKQIRAAIPEFVDPGDYDTCDRDYDLDGWRERIAAEITRLEEHPQ